jgi:hypothetical protein
VLPGVVRVTVRINVRITAGSATDPGLRAPLAAVGAEPCC